MKKYADLVEKYRGLMLEAEKYLWNNPETGYREHNTCEYMAREFEKLGYNLTRARGITGFYTVVDTKKEGPTVLVFAELDSISVPAHKNAKGAEGYVHACGHHSQMAAILGIAAALSEREALEGLSGRIKLCIVPAEELIELDYRGRLRAEGKIKYFCGKTEFLHRGYLDDCSLALMVHASTQFCVNGGFVGCIAKTVRFKGVSAHAGGAAWQGVNSLYAASVALSAANALRETFKENDCVKFHPIITHGGDVVNTIPELTTLEAFVRAGSIEAMISYNSKINRAFAGAALSMGANVDIIDTAGYAPLRNDVNLVKIVKEAADAVIPEENFKTYSDISSGSTDMGELSQIMPVLHAFCAGSSGRTHGDDYCIADKERAIVKSAKLQIAMIRLLLCDNAKRAREVVNEYTPPFKSKEELFEAIDKIQCSGERIIYGEGRAEIKL